MAVGVNSVSRSVMPVLATLTLLVGCATRSHDPMPRHHLDRGNRNDSIDRHAPTSFGLRAARLRGPEPWAATTDSQRAPARQGSVAQGQGAARPEETMAVRAKRVTGDAPTFDHRREAAVAIEPAAVDAPERADAIRSPLGDGSIPGELIAAAQRLLGMRDAFADGDSMVRHLLAAAAIDLKLAAGSPQRFISAVWEELERTGRTHASGQPRPGDIVFFHAVHDLDSDGRSDDRLSAVAVVERVSATGVATCIGDLHGLVRRFAVDRSRPGVHRDELRDELVNTPIRRRSLEDRPETPTLAGALLAGYASFGQVGAKRSDSRAAIAPAASQSSRGGE